MLIIGSGPAGYTAAVYGARAMLKPIVVQGIQPGGQLTITTEVENWPGIKEIQGPDLMVNLEAHAKVAGASIEHDTINRLDLSQFPFIAHGEGEKKYEARSIVLATGAQANWLGLDSENKYKGFGVSACATCDGFFFKERKVAVIGGGNSAVEEALYLTNFASKVYLVHRRNELRAEKILQDRLFKNEKVECVWDSELKEIIGDEDPLNVKSINIKNTKTGETSNIELDGVFIAIGHDPATQIFRDQVEMDEEGYIMTRPDSTLTNVEGVYAAGDVKDKIYRQAVTAAGMGCMAALEAEKYLAELS